MKHFGTRFLSYFLILGTLAGTAGCSGSQSASVPAGDSTAASSAVETEPEEEPIVLPAGDYKGKKFNILLRSSSWTPMDIYTAELNGEVLNDAVYARNKAIEADYNVQLYGEVAAEATGPALNTAIQSFVAAGDKTWDLVMIRVSDAASLAQSGVFFDLLQSEKLDFRQSFWQYDQLMETTIAGRMYYASGLGINAGRAVNAVFLNKDIARDNGIESLYSVVKDGKFTYDVLQECAQKAAKDLNGDGAMTKEDRFGISAQEGVCRMLFTSAGEALFTKDENDTPVFILEGNKRAFDVADRIQTIMADRNSNFIGETADMREVWYNNGALFYFASISNADEALRESDIDYGILPLPKYNEEQDRYWCYMNAHNPCGDCIPVTADFEGSALMLHVLAGRSQKEVIPAYFDTVLSGKSLRDRETEDMLDIIFSSWRADHADAYAWSGITSWFTIALRDGTGLASLLASYSESVRTAVAATVEKYRTLQ